MASQKENGQFKVILLFHKNHKITNFPNLSVIVLLFLRDGSSIHTRNGSRAACRPTIKDEETSFALLDSSQVKITNSKATKIISKQTPTIMCKKSDTFDL